MSGGESGEAVGDGDLEFGKGAGGGSSQLGLEFAESHFDRVEIRAVSGEVADGGALGRNQLGDGGDLMGGKIVEDDDVVLFEFRTQDLAQVGGEDLGIDRPFNEEGCGDAVAA